MYFLLNSHIIDTVNFGQALCKKNSYKFWRIKLVTNKLTNKQTIYRTTLRRWVQKQFQKEKTARTRGNDYHSYPLIWLLWPEPFSVPRHFVFSGGGTIRPPMVNRVKLDYTFLTATQSSHTIPPRRRMAEQTGTLQFVQLPMLTGVGKSKHTLSNKSQSASGISSALQYKKLRHTRTPATNQGKE